MPESTLPAAAPVVQPTEWVTFKIDGSAVRAPKGTNVLEACLQQGTDVSYFCYHPGLSSPAVCRQCLVEVNGQIKLVPSCYTPVAENMEVVTNSERVLQARAQMLEFTLVNHPIDCPICDKAGECTLQKMYMEWDGQSKRSDLERVHKPKAVDLGPTVVLDAERCILCSRCIRVCDEVAGQHQLEMSYRGDHEVLGVAPGQQLDNPYSLNTVDVCPVGALTSKDFRFRMRVWELYTTPSVCAGCSTGCNIEVHHHQNEIWRLIPRENQAVNQHWMCDEGRMTYKEVRSNRLASARLGLGKGLPAQLAAYDRAVAWVAQRLAQLRAEGVPLGLVFGAQASNEALFALRQVAEAWSGSPVYTYVLGRAERPERADAILRTADVNPNTLGAQTFAGEQARGWKELQRDLQQGTVQALWMVGEDLPLTAEAPWMLVRPLFESLRLLVVQAVHHTDLVRLAHAMLPATAWAETNGSFLNKQGLVQRTRSAVTPAGDARAHVEWIAAIAQKMGLLASYPWISQPKRVFEQMAHTCAQWVETQPDHVQTAVWHTLSTATWGIDKPAVQLRFAHSRG